jgi:hypothetical protein
MQGVQQWKYDWLECCETLIQYPSNVEEMEFCQLEVSFQNLQQFKRTVHEFKGWGDLDAVWRRLRGDGGDQSLAKIIGRVRSNDQIMQILEDIWQNDDLEPIKTLQSLIDGRLRDIISAGMLPEWYFEDQVFEEEEAMELRGSYESNLSYYAFICFRRFRDTPDRRNSWASIYYKIEDARRLLRLQHLPHPNDKGDTWWTWTQTIMNEGPVRESADRYAELEQMANDLLLFPC